MDPEDQLAREEEILEREFNDGEMTRAEFNAAVSNLHRDFRADAEEAARDAYDRELDRW